MRDLARTADSVIVLERISRELEQGIAMVVAEIAVPDPDVLDKTLGALDGTRTEEILAATLG